MNKPVVFLSHSVRDKSLLRRVKDTLLDVTSGVVDFFLSSDGQSIQLGTNWVHSIQKALESCELMFVFISPSAVSSQWIHFETGFAYSKGIQVVPVGILDQDVGLLKPPMSLLQGFNLQDSDSFGNILTLVNSKYDCTFPVNISEDKYRSLFVGISPSLFSSRGDNVKSFAFYGQDNKQIGLPLRLEKYLMQQKQEYAVSETVGRTIPSTRIDMDAISINFMHYPESDHFSIDVDPSYWQDRLKQVRNILNWFAGDIVDKPRFSIHLRGCYIAVKQKHKILPRLKAYGVSLQVDGSFKYKDRIVFWIDTEIRFGDKGEQYEGDPVVKFMIAIEELDIRAIAPIIDMLFSAGILQEGYGDVWEL